MKAQPPSPAMKVFKILQKGTEQKFCHQFYLFRNLQVNGLTITNDKSALNYAGKNIILFRIFA